jgi:predicted RNA-binding protein YlqC (UPF0109 family)
LLRLLDKASNLARNQWQSFNAPHRGEVHIAERTDGKTIVVLTVNLKDKGVAIGKNGKNAERLRFLAKRYCNKQNVSIA